MTDSSSFETLLAETSCRFINLDPDRIDGEIHKILKQIGNLLSVDRCFVFHIDSSGRRHRVTHLWTRRERPNDPVVVGTVVQEGFPWVGEKMLHRQEILVNRLDELPPDADSERAYCRDMGIKSFLMLPMYSRDLIVGLIGVDAIQSERQWHEKDLRRLRLLGEILANALIRKQKDQEILKLKERLEAENIYLREEARLSREQTDIVGNSAPIRRVLAQAEQVAATGSTVLILGETGTGKQLLARMIHRLSKLRDRPLVTVNCGALSPTLIEAELFGKEKGAYTGAVNKQIGRFEIADGSTLFLDEIGELPLEIQAKFLRVLENGEFERLGGPKTIRVRARIIAATNRDLSQAVRDGTFREDLFYRLNVFPITLPPLRERRGDIPLLAWAFVKELEIALGRRIEQIPKAGMDFLQAQPWPGNVRELRNLIEHSMILSRDKRLELFIADKPSTKATKPNRSLREVEKDHISKVLKERGWRVRGRNGAAEILDLKPSTLESRMKKLGIRRP